MKTIITIFRKELLDTIRDKRTLFSMVVIPIMLFPVIFTLTGNFTSSQQEKQENKKLEIGIQSNNNANKLVSSFRENKKFSVTELTSAALIDSLVKNEHLDAGILISQEFDTSLARNGNGNIELFYLSTESWKKERVQKILAQYEKHIISNRLAQLNVQSEYIDPVTVKNHDVATEKQRFGETLGSMLPYVFILFCFIGAIYPAIDMFTGEKERGTIETILTIPAGRLQLLTGKLLAIVLVGMSSAILSIVGLYLGIQFADFIPASLQDIVDNILSFDVIVLLLLMLLPLTIFLAGLLTLITVYARSFKEAQSIISPLTILVILPAIIGAFPGIEFNALTAIIPIVNISLATKGILAGTINPGMYILVLVSLIVFASAALLLCMRWFKNERNILRI
jgi:sodium transport system permease protein